MPEETKKEAPSFWTEERMLALARGTMHDPRRMHFWMIHCQPMFRPKVEDKK